MPLEYHLSGCVTKTFVLDFALLFVHGKPMKIHATCDIIIHPGRISLGTPILDSSGVCSSCNKHLK